MKKLAKLTTVFTVICMALALGACGHSGSDYDWKNPNGSSGPDVSAYVGTWGAYWIDWSSTTHPYYEYIVIEKDGTYIYWKLGEDGNPTSNSQKGTCTDVTGNKLTLTATYWYDTDNGKWDTATGDPYGLYMEVDESGESASVTAMGWEENIGTFVIKPSN